MSCLKCQDITRQKELNTALKLMIWMTIFLIRAALIVTTQSCLIMFEGCAGGRRAAKIFQRLDVDDNGELDENEFVRGCLDDAEFLRLLTRDQTSTDTQDNDQPKFEYDDHVPKLEL